MTIATPARAAEASQSTIKTYLRPIDRDGLRAFAEKGRNNPGARGTNKVHTVVDGKFRTLSYVGDHTPVVVDENVTATPEAQPVALTRNAASPNVLPPSAPNVIV